MTVHRSTNKARLAVALDLQDKDSCLEIAKQLKDLPVILKLGLGMLPLLDSADIIRLRDQGFDLFIDAKLHDIPSQVERAVNAWNFLGAKYLTLHLSGGERMLSMAADSTVGMGITLLGVTVLTSLSSKDLQAIGVENEMNDQVSQLFHLGLQTGIRGFVASVSEIESLREQSTKLSEAADLVFVTPGIVIDPGKGHPDQSRTSSVQEAIKAGSNILVMGRSILQSPSPRETVEHVLSIMSASFPSGRS